MERSKLLLVDGMALLFRAFYATAPSGQFMINSKGMPTNGVQGFFRHLLLSIDEVAPTHLAVCWDMGQKTFRHQLFDGYKANRSAPPVEMIPQFDLAKSMTESFGIPNIGLPGYEADDCIGTISRQMRSQMDIRILTGDRDLLQLLDRHVHVRILQKGFGNYARYTENQFIETVGITPQQFIDVKALMGDASDGYPGVHGIGEKTAVKLIRQFGSLKTLLDQLDSLPSGQQNKIRTDLDMLKLSRQLAEIHCDVPIELDLAAASYTGLSDVFIQHVRDEEMKLVSYAIIQSQHVDNTDKEQIFPF